VAAGLVRAIRLVNELLLDKTRDLPGVKGLGATVVAGLCAKDGFLTLAHVGDSRAYLLRQGILERLTFDHTVPEMLLQNGLINRRQLRRHPARHVITRHIGMEDCPPANAALLRLQPGDRILFCTDGLTGMLADREIGAILQETPGCKAACRRLIDGANEAGGTDNITAVIVDVEALQRGRGRRRQRLVVRRGIGRSLTPPQDAPMHAKGLVPPSADNAKGNAP
jgi:protein phosphatase